MKTSRPHTAEATFATEGASAETTQAIPAIRVNEWTSSKPIPTDIQIEAIRMIQANLAKNAQAPTYLIVAGLPTRLMVCETAAEIHGMMSAAGRPWRIGVVKA